MSDPISREAEELGLVGVTERYWKRLQRLSSGPPSEFHQVMEASTPRIRCKKSGLVIGCVHLNEGSPHEPVVLHAVDDATGGFNSMCTVSESVGLVIRCPAHAEGHTLPAIAPRPNRTIRI